MRMSIYKIITDFYTIVNFSIILKNAIILIMLYYVICYIMLLRYMLE